MQAQEGTVRRSVTLCEGSVFFYLHTFARMYTYLYMHMYVYVCVRTCVAFVHKVRVMRSGAICS